MTLRTYIDHAIRDGAAFDAVICGCDVQQTFCWQPDMCITDACEAEYRPLLDAEIRILAAAPGERFSIIEICTDRLFLDGQALSRRRLFAVRGGLLQPARVPEAVPRRIKQAAAPAPKLRLWGGRFYRRAPHSAQENVRSAAGVLEGGKARLESDLAVFQLQSAGENFCRAPYSA